MLFVRILLLPMFALMMGLFFDNAALAQNQALAQSPIDLSGIWSSQYGDVNLQVLGKDKDGHLVVSGYWKNGQSEGKITWGRFTPTMGSGVLKMEYFLPGRPMYGYAEFSLQASGVDLDGKYWEGSSNGVWNLKRKAGYKINRLGNIPLLTTGLGERGNKIFEVQGKWLSNFGEVDLQGVSLSSTGWTLKGTWKNFQGQEGKILSGLFMRDPSGGILRIEYFAPWNKSQGKGEFRPDRYLGGRMLVGIYREGNNSGPWILCRPPDPNKK